MAVSSVLINSTKTALLFAIFKASINYEYDFTHLGKILKLTEEQQNVEKNIAMIIFDMYLLIIHLSFLFCFSNIN